MDKIALYHCNTIDEIQEKVELIIRDLGTDRISELFHNKKVLLKPNLCIDLPPEKGATTHPAVLEAVIKIAKKYGAKIIIGDGACIGVKLKLLKNTGIGDLCEKYNIPFVDFNRIEGRSVKIRNAYKFHEALIAKTYFEIDTFVNLPVFKSNILHWISGALKNMKGLLVGMEKHKPHYLGIPECVADINSALKQDLIIMDGFIGMMGNGPTTGAPAGSRLLIGGFDPVAVDALAAKLMGFNLEKIPMIMYSSKAKVGSLDYTLTGDPIESFNIRFDKPLIAKNRLIAKVINGISGIVFKKFKTKSRMIVDHEKCDRCSRCIEMCPFNAISKKEDLISIDSTKCEFCFCCTEICKNEAISLEGMLMQKARFIRSA